MPIFLKPKRTMFIKSNCLFAVGPKCLRHKAHMLLVKNILDVMSVLLKSKLHRVFNAPFSKALCVYCFKYVYSFSSKCQ